MCAWDGIAGRWGGWCLGCVQVMDQVVAWIKAVADLRAMFLIVERTMSAIAAGRASYRVWRCLWFLWEGPGGVP